jgi:coniferyl-aldehyde dehydrogenase
MRALVPVDSDLRGQLERLRRAQRDEGATTLDQRLTLLRRLEQVLLRDRERVAEALMSDFGVRARHETLMAEVLTVVWGIREVRRQLRRWMRPRRVRVSWLYRPGRAHVQPQPKGVVGIMGAWNYPVNLALAPVVAAIAAGNRVMVKPSEIAPRAAEVVKAILTEAIGESRVVVTLGDVQIAEAFSRLPFDHLLFTGSTDIGRKVMAAASENLVPVTLELGGKSPVIVTEDRFTRTGLKRTAYSIAFGKLLNAGQTCIAPDYALLPEGRVDDFVEAFRDTVTEMYPSLLDNSDYTAIIDERHAGRLLRYVREAADRKVRIEEINPAEEDLGGQTKKLAPTLIVDPPDDLAVMREEIFGPILPVLTYGTLEEAIAHVNARARPLALYVFSDDRRKVRRILERTTSGGVCVNEVALQFAEDRLPFGGIGDSGMGAYHGRAGFETFSHLKPVFARTRFDPMSLFRPPYGRRHDRFLDWLFGR